MTETTASFLDRLKSYPLYFLPHHAISRIVFHLTRLGGPLKNPSISWFMRTFDISLQEAVIQDINKFATFNDFFTRELKPGVREISSAENALCCPVDGAISQLGDIVDGRILQAKGHDYSMLELIGGDEDLAKYFSNGQFITLYLSPRDYHRIHMPVTGKLEQQIYVPGRLFSVAQHTARCIPRLFSRNERVVAVFDTEFGKLAMVLVGAINVAAIETVWDGLITPPNGRDIQRKTYSSEQAIVLEKGIEMGRFNMGSTVILVTEQKFDWEQALKAGSSVQLGNLLATSNIA